MRILAAFDKFKGTMDAAGAGMAVTQAIAALLPGKVAEPVVLTGLGEGTAVPPTCVLPVSDGGDGFLAALSGPLNLETVSARVTGPTGEPMDSQYGISADGHTAVIEVASASGLADALRITGGVKLPLQATSAGTGELLAAAYAKGARELIVGLGGSACNDGGLGLVHALNPEFVSWSSQSPPAIANGASLSHVTGIQSGAGSLLPGAKVIVCCDVDSPLTGPKGATAVFGPQKGVGEAEAAVLEPAMVEWGKALDAFANKAVSESPGAGAAGGIGAALLATMDAKMVSGAVHIAGVLGLQDAIAQADLVVTGEGAYDATTSTGKAVSIVESTAAELGKPLVIVAGVVEPDARATSSAKLLVSLVETVGKDKSLNETEAALKEAVTATIRQWPVIGGAHSN